MKGFLHELHKNKILFLMLLPAVFYFILFSYIPMAGSIVAFKRFNYDQGIFQSPWNGFENFRFFFISGQAWKVTRNTFLYNVMFMITGNILQIILAIFLTEIHSKLFRKISQTLMFLPYFISWVVAGTFAYNLFNYEFGTINALFRFLGIQPVDVYSNPAAWKYILLFFNSWKWAGYGSVVYLAAILGIDPELYEAAQIDGAGVLSKIRRITLPLLTPTVIILVLLNIGRIFRGDFDMFFQLVGDSGNLFNATNVIDTYVFRALMRNSDFGMASAAAFYQSVLCFGTIFLVNFVIRRINRDYALF